MGGRPETNAQAVRDLLDGAPSAYRDAVLLNAAAALLVAGKTQSKTEAVALARESIDSGSARKKLAQLVALTSGAT